MLTFQGCSGRRGWSVYKARAQFLIQDVHGECNRKLEVDAAGRKPYIFICDCCGLSMQTFGFADRSCLVRIHDFVLQEFG